MIYNILAGLKVDYEIGHLQIRELIHTSEGIIIILMYNIKGLTI